MYKVKHKSLRTDWILFRQEEEIAHSLTFQMRHLPSIYAVRVDNNFALLGLAKKLHQAHRGNSLAPQKVSQHIPRTYRGQLIGVTYQQQVRFFWQRFEQMIKEQDIDHRELIDNDKLIRQRVLFIALEGIVMRRIFKQAMQRFRLESRSLRACGLGEPLGGTSCWSGKGYIDLAFAQQHQQGAN